MFEPCFQSRKGKQREITVALEEEERHDDDDGATGALQHFAASSGTLSPPKAFISKAAVGPTLEIGSTVN